MSQAEIARRLEISRATYARYETRTPLPHHLVPEFAAVTGADITGLLDRGAGRRGVHLQIRIDQSLGRRPIYDGVLPCLPPSITSKRRSPRTASLKKSRRHATAIRRLLGTPCSRC